MDTSMLAARARAARKLPAPVRARQLRLAAGVELAEMAALIGVSRRSLWLWELGKVQPNGTNAVRYAEALEVLALELGATDPTDVGRTEKQTRRPGKGASKEQN
jgi:transcriptional regulator with XRE-family HTH domain